MMRGVRRRAALAIIGVAMVVLTGCQPGDPFNGRANFQPIRYRLTATVETPQGERTAFSVIESSTNRSITRVKVRGEAVAVELPGGEALFVLLRSASMIDWAASLPGIPVIEADVPAHGLAERQVQLERQFAAMAQDRDVYYLWGPAVAKERAQYLPYMVRFRDPADPKSVEKVDPADLAKSFGPGYRLKSLTVQVTDDPVTRGIEKRLGWLARLRGVNLDGTRNMRSGTPLAARIGDGDFRQGFVK